MTANLAMAAAMAAILMTWSLAYLSVSGLGVALQRVLVGKSARPVDPLFSFWVGLAVAIGWLQVWHLFFPVNGWCALALVLTGVAAHVVDRWAIPQHALATVWRRPWTSAAAALTIVWLANRATGPCDAIDSGLYHWNVIRWCTDYSIVPGLGNLHVRLGSNQSSLLYSTVLDQGWWRGRSNHVANGLLLALLALQGFRGAVRCRDGIPSTAVDAIWLIPAILMSNHWWISSHSTDVAPAAMLMVAASAMFRLRKTEHPDLQAALVPLVLAAAACMKATTAPLAALLWLVCTFRSKCGQLVAIAVGCSAALVVPWLIRGVILTGYPLYPSGLISMPVDWRLPEDLLAAENEHIRAFARVHNDAFDPSNAHLWKTWKWLPIWVSLLEREVVIPLVVATSILALMIRWGRTWTQVDWWVVAAALAAIGFWFLTAPDTRFGFFLFWILLGALSAGIMDAIAAAPISRRVFAGVILGVAIGNVKKPWTPPSSAGLHPSARMEMVEYRSQRGARVFVPESGRLCFDGPLPCTPYPDPQLEQRTSHDLAGGYRIVR